MRRDDLLAPMAVLAGLGYAVLRYVIAAGASPEQIPLFITNKAIAVAGLVLIGMASLVPGARRHRLGTTGLLLVLLHLLMSFAILNPVYFAKFYAPTGYMHWQAELSLLAGALGTVVLVRLATVPVIADGFRSLIPGAGRLVLLLSALHVGAIGYPSWSDTAHWPGRLPPITLLSFLLAMGFVVARLRPRDAA